MTPCPLSCTTRAPCRSVISAVGQRATAALWVASATSKSSTPAAGDGWIHEIKLDGFRLLARP
jgi:ATP-dependent DNA ligase